MAANAAEAPVLAPVPESAPAPPPATPAATAAATAKPAGAASDGAGAGVDASDHHVSAGPAPPLSHAHGHEHSALYTQLAASGTATAANMSAFRRRWDRWLILAVVSVSVLLVSIQSASLIIAFPTLVRELDTDLQTILWVLLSFLLVVTCVVPISGKLGDIFGQAIMMKIGLAIFTIASLLSGFSQPSAHGYDLVFYRSLTGLGAAFVFTNSSALITDAFILYNQVGVAQGTFQLVAATGSVLGPIVGGGFAVTDWRWIFWFNVPIGFLCTVIGISVIHDGEPARKRRESKRKPWRRQLADFDWAGAVMLIGGILLVMLAMTQAVLPSPPLSSPAGLACLIVFGVLCLVVFAVCEHYATDPLIVPELWRNRVFVLSAVSGGLISFARSNVTNTLIFFLQGPYGEDPLTAGLQLIPFGLGIVLVGFPAGRLADKYGVRLLACIGTSVAVVGMVGLAFIQPTTNYWLIALALFVVGIGNGLFNAPNGLAGMTAVTPQQRGVAAAVRMLLSQFGAMVGIVVTFALILNSLSYTQLLALFIYGGGGLSPSAVDSLMQAYQDVYWIIISTTVVATACNLARPPDTHAHRKKAPAAGAPAGSTAAMLPSPSAGPSENWEMAAVAAAAEAAGETYDEKLDSRTSSAVPRAATGAATAAAAPTPAALEAGAPLAGDKLSS